MPSVQPSDPYAKAVALQRIVTETEMLEVTAKIADNIIRAAIRSLVKALNGEIERPVDVDHVEKAIQNLVSTLRALVPDDTIWSFFELGNATAIYATAFCRSVKPPYWDKGREFDSLLANCGLDRTTLLPDESEDVPVVWPALPESCYAWSQLEIGLQRLRNQLVPTIHQKNDLQSWLVMTTDRSHM